MSNNSSGSSGNTAYLPMLNAAENWGMVGSQIVSICLCNFLLLLRTCWPGRVKQMSTSMVFLLVGHSIGNMSAFPYTLQRTLVLWDPKAWLYPTYWLAVANSCYLVMTSYFNMTITLDRLLVLSLPYGISRLNVSLRKIRKASLTLLILLYLALELALLLLYMQMIPLDAAAVLKCSPILCMGSPGTLLLQTAMKPIFGILNLAFSVLFLWKLKKFNSQSINNRLVKFTAWAEILMDIVPYIITQSFQMITGQSIANYAGSFRTLFNYAEVAFCAIYYNSVFVKWGSLASIGGMFNSGSQPLQQNVGGIQQQQATTRVAWTKNVITPVNNNTMLPPSTTHIQRQNC